MPKQPQKTPQKHARPKRRNRGFLQTGNLLQKNIRSIGEKRGFVHTRLLTEWEEIAGAAIAKIAQPTKVGYTKQGFGATLTLLCNGANAPMLQMQIPQLIKRVNGCYGYNAIARIRITQTAPTGFDTTTPTGFGEPKSGFGHQTAQKAAQHRKLSAQEADLIEVSLKDVADTQLKDALAKLGKNILTRRG